MGWGGVLVRRRGRMGTKEEEGGGGENAFFSDQVDGENV